MSNEDLWERNARWWQDCFTDGADVEYEEQILPMAAAALAGARDVLDVGCGEGQLARLAAGHGATRVVGIDPTWAQLATATERARGPVYARAVAAALPLQSASFDAVIACLVFEHITAIDEAIAEVARVLRAGGRFLFFLNHPLLQTPNSGWIDDHVLDPPEQYWRIGPYLPEDATVEEVADGVQFLFVHRPLHRYVNALSANGLLVHRMEEPPPAPGFVAGLGDYATTIPRTLYLEAVKQQ
jgi:SAM-dependent methyltransferase